MDTEADLIVGVDGWPDLEQAAPTGNGEVMGRQGLGRSGGEVHLNIECGRTQADFCAVACFI